MEQTKDFKCYICGKPFELGKQAYMVVLGEFNKTEFGIAFDEPYTELTKGYAHFSCLEKEAERK